MNNKQISDKLLEMAKFYQMTDEELVVIGKVVEMVRSADDDLISRQAAITAVAVGELGSRTIYGRSEAGMLAFRSTVESIRDIPSVTPQQKVGRWIWNNGHHVDYCKCSECGCGEWEMEWKYCPNCGAKMVETQESEVQK